MEETTLAAAVGRKIANLRKERGLTQRQLADRIYTSDKNLSKWETGKALPDLSFLLSICSTLGVQITYFTDENISCADILQAQRNREIKARMRKFSAAVFSLLPVPLFIFAAAAAYLPSPLPVHFNAQWQADKMGQPWQLSLGCIIVTALIIATLGAHYIYYTKSPSAKAFQSKGVLICFYCVVLLLEVFNIAVGITALATSVSAANEMGLVPPDIERFPVVFAALMCLIMWLAGTLCAFVSRNEWVGFRIPSAYESDYNWRAYNATAGVAFMAYALALALAMIFMPRPLNEAEALTASLVPLIPLAIVSYFIGKAIIKRHGMKQ